jgi:hypothetical protein
VAAARRPGRQATVTASRVGLLAQAYSTACIRACTPRRQHAPLCWHACDSAAARANSRISLRRSCTLQCSARCTLAQRHLTPLGVWEVQTRSAIPASLRANLNTGTVPCDKKPCNSNLTRLGPRRLHLKFRPIARLPEPCKSERRVRPLSRDSCALAADFGTFWTTFTLPLPS